MAGSARMVAAFCFALLVALGAAGASALAAGGKQGPKTDGPYYMRSLAVVAPQFVDGGIVHVGVLVSIEIPELADYDRARELTPRLIDAFVRELNGIMSGPFVRENGVDHAVVKRRFLAAAVRILGKSVARDVLVEKSYRRRVS